MQNLDVKDTIQKIKKTKSETKKELEELIANGKRNENANMQEKVNGCTTNKDAVKVIQRSCAQEFEDITRAKKTISYDYSTIKTKYFKSLKKKNLFLAWI